MNTTTFYTLAGLAHSERGSRHRRRHMPPARRALPLAQEGASADKRKILLSLSSISHTQKGPRDDEGGHSRVTDVPAVTGAHGLNHNHTF